MGPATEKIRLATFDCYGTLIDWEAGAAAFLYQLARRHEPVPPPARELRDRWEALQFERLQGGWLGYRSVLADSLAELAGEYGWRWNDHDGEALARSMESWQPFPDTVPALREIDVPPEQILHVAFGFKYDIAPAQQLGMRSAWVNRHQEPAPGDALPDYEWSDLWPLAGLGSPA